MLPVVLILLAATSALAAPGVNVNIASINDVAPPRNPGTPVSSYITSQAIGLRDEGDLNIYILQVTRVLNDLANLPGKRNQAIALAQAIGLVGALSTGNPGDACASANLINAYSSAVQTGNYGQVKSALAYYVDNLSRNIDLIGNLAQNPQSARYSVGSRGNCNGGGRSYSFESAWDSVLSAADSRNAGLLNEQYCGAKRLYNAFSSLSNNVAAEITAASLPPVADIFLSAYNEASRFLATVPAGGSAAAAGAVKAALRNAINNVSF